jgi:hypothetical protein
MAAAAGLLCMGLFSMFLLESGKTSVIKAHPTKAQWKGRVQVLS